MSARAVNSTDVIQRPAKTETARSTSVADVACRALDVVGSLILLVIVAPLLLVIAVAIRLESTGPALFRQGRLGRSLTPFTVNKFRTMRAGASQEAHREFVLSLMSGEQPTGDDGKPLFKMAADTRITRVGRILRRTSLDELPQLWNVLRGDMSLVGPRPPIAYEVENYPSHWFARFDVKPGLTGLWQVKGRSQVPLEEMVALDIEYVRRRSLWLNIWILLCTIPAVLKMRGAV